jgi:ketosteroid isomerase-like protein
MRKLFLVIAVFTASVIPAFAQTPAKPTEQANDTEQTILKLTRDWLAAEEATDRATLRRIIADDFQGTAAMGRTVFKEDVIPQEGSRGGLAMTTSEVKARVFGDTAVVTGHGVTKSAEKRELRFTVIFARRGDSWQMVAGHLSAVPKE